MSSEKLRTSLQEKLTKQNEITRQTLARELSKLDESEKHDMRILDIARQRFRMRCKKLGVCAVATSGYKAMDVRMYETHNPGFCYHRNGTIKESGLASSVPVIVDSDDSYELVRAMLFTNGEIDIEKLLCLHLLAAHTAKNVDGRVTVLERNSSSILDRDQSQPLIGAWNNFLPCYVVEIQRDECSERQNLCRETRRGTIEKENLRDFELSCKTYARDNADIVRSVLAHERMAKMAPQTFGKMPIISPHVYTILGASHEFRVKRSIAEGGQTGGNDGMRSNVQRSSIQSIIPDATIPRDDFRFFDDYDTSDVTDRAIELAKNDRNSVVLEGLTKISANHAASNSLSPSRVSWGCGKIIDRSITMLKGNSWRNGKFWRTTDTREDPTRDELVAIKPSNVSGFLENFESKSSCERTDFRKPQQNRGSVSSENTWNSTIEDPRCKTIKYRTRIYLNSPIKSFALRKREYRVVDILVNNQIQTLVHSVLDVLERVNPDKVQRILEIARDFRKIRDIFERVDIQKFVKSLLGQPIVTSPNSFVVLRATAIDEIDSRLEDLIGDELVAVTMQLPAFQCLELLVEEIRDNIFGYLENSDAETVNVSSGNWAYDDRLIDDQRQGMPIGKDDAIHENESPMKRKTKEITDPYDSNEEKSSRDATRVLREFDKVEEKLVVSRKNRYKLTKNSGTKRTDDKESNGDSKTSQKGTLDIGYLDPDHVILRRMTNSQRILVGRMCTALKNRRINNEGLIRGRTPRAALITPVLSRESIKMLTRGTIYSKFTGTMRQEKKKEHMVAKLTGPVLAKVRHDIAEHETKRRLDSFFAN